MYCLSRWRSWGCHSWWWFSLPRRQHPHWRWRRRWEQGGGGDHLSPVTGVLWLERSKTDFGRRKSGSLLCRLAQLWTTQQLLLWTSGSCWCPCSILLLSVPISSLFILITSLGCPGWFKIGIKNSIEIIRFSWISKVCGDSQTLY